MTKKILIIFFLFLHLPAYAQVGNLFITNYPPTAYYSKDYVASLQNWSMFQDKNGMLFISNSERILMFDGVKWKALDSSDATAKASFAEDSLGNIWIASGYYTEIGKLIVDDRGNIHFHSMKSLLPAPYNEKEFAIKYSLATSNAVYFFSDTVTIKWANEKFSVSLNPFILNSVFTDAKKTYGYSNTEGLVTFEDDHWISIPNSPVFSQLKVVSVISRDQDHSLQGNFIVITNGNGIYFFDGNKLTPIKTDLTDQLNGAKITSAGILNAQYIVICTANQGCFIADYSGQLVTIINRKGGLINEEVLNYFVDRTGGLWLTLQYGLARIQFPSVLTFLDYTNDLKGSRVNKILRDGNILYAGTSSGLFQMNLKDSQKKFKEIFSGPEVTDILQIQNDLLFTSEDGVHVLHNGLLSKINMESLRPHCLMLSHQFINIVFAGTDHGLQVLQYADNQWQLMGAIKGVTDAVYYLAEDSKSLWASSESVYRIDFSSSFSFTPAVTHFDKNEGFEGKVFECYHIDGKILFGTRKGIYQYDQHSNKLKLDSAFAINFHNGAREASVLAEDGSGNIWLTSESIAGVMRKQANQYVWDTTDLQKLPVGFTLWSILIDSNRVWLGTDLGIFILDRFLLNRSSSSFKTLIRRFETGNDSALYFGFDSPDLKKGNFARKQFILPYDQRDVAFEFAATDYENPERLRYSYKLEGKSQTWSEYSPDPRKEFNNLKEGEYKFDVMAKNFYGDKSQVATFAFTILPPWFRTWWAYILYTVLLALLIYLIVRLNHRRLIASKRRLELIVTERTQQLEQKTNQLEHALTDLKNTQTQLIQSEKMASLGQLTAGVAHEINNPINFVSANINPLKRDIDEIMRLLDIYTDLDKNNYSSKLDEISKYKDQINLKYTTEEIKSLLKGIEEGSFRTAEIVKGLRNFSRLDEEEMKTANIHEGIESTLVILQNKLKQQNIEVIKTYSDLPDIECFPGQLNQVFMNLLTNAIDAIGMNGKIYVSTSAQNNQVQISIRDTGAGMSDEVRQKIFDPFFTTKEVGKGTGLGLSISYGIIEKHRGKIEVKSEVGKGTEFIITLPAHQLY